MKLLGRIWCRLFGHRRARRVAGAMVEAGKVLMVCPRCGASKTRRERKKA